ncbi:MAG: hypothetical protein IJ452_08005 [Butyricicoccus sp.]|nr:hypothetical protein [Butyricicoccus sp.]
MEGYDIFFEGKPVGKTAVSEETAGIRYDAVCTLKGDSILRLYGVNGGRFLPIGVLSPHGGYWHISRTVSRQTLRDHGFETDLPTQFLLSEHPPQNIRTGDPLIDAAVGKNGVTVCRTADGCEVSCPFDPTVPSPLAFALTACRIESARAVLHLTI